MTPRLLTRNLFALFFAAAIPMSLITGCDGGADGSGIRAASFGEVVLEPSSFRFPILSVGDSAERKVVVRNVGAGVLSLARFAPEFSTEYSLYWHEGTEPGTPQLVGVENGVSSLPEVIDVEPGNAITFILQYTPQTDEPPSGRLRMRTNAATADLRDLAIPIRGASANAEIVVSPNVLDFGRVALGESISQEVTVSNIGQLVANIENIRVDQSANFVASINGISTAQDPSVFADPDGDGEPGLSPEAFFTLTITFTAEFERADQGELIISSNSVVPNVTVNLLANGSAPCISVVPTELEFGAGMIGRPNERLLTIESCGGQALQINSLSVTEGGDTFVIPPEEIDGRLPGRLAAADLQADPPVRPSWSLPVLFTPQAEQPYTGMIVVESTDPNRPSIEVPLRGRGSINECPVAAVTEDELIVRPLDVITLDGSRSVDTDGPNGQPVAYEWVVTQRPDGSTAVPVERLASPLRPAEGGPEDDTGTPTATFFVDLAGTYVIELRVTDSEGVSAPSEACPQPEATVTIIANPNEDIHLQLVWDTPMDPDQTDLDGSDVDLHFLHPLGNDWFRGGGIYDCYFANPTPDWGQANSPDDNPSLDIDDTNGAGPENINLDRPENTQNLGGPYRVGVHYYRASIGPFGGESYGESDVTIRIYLGGNIVYEETRIMRDTNDFWEVAGIIWTGAEQRVVEIDQMSVRAP